jgi:hypothetical protein
MEHLMGIGAASSAKNGAAKIGVSLNAASCHETNQKTDSTNRVFSRELQTRIP